MTPIRIPYRLLKIELDLESETAISSFLAATIRGGFGYTLRRMVCIQRNAECLQCMMRNSCIYPFLFETPPPPDALRMSKYLNVPRPFAFRPRQAGKSVEMDLLLIGKAVEMTPFFIHTLNELGKKGLGKHKTPFVVTSVHLYDNSPVYDSRQPDECAHVTPEILEITPGKPSHGTLTLDFTTPLVIRKDTTILASFEPYPFFTTLLRRVTNLNAFYGTDPSGIIDPQPWLDAANTISCETDVAPVQQQRFSTRQNRKIDYSGIVGKVRLTGDVGTLLPLIKAGEALGVGKNTVFGYGVFGVA